MSNVIQSLQLCCSSILLLLLLLFIIIIISLGQTLAPTLGQGKCKTEMRQSDKKASKEKIIRNEVKWAPESVA